MPSNGQKDGQAKKEVKEEPVEEEEDSLKLRLLLSAEQQLDEGYPLLRDESARQRYGSYVFTCDSYTPVVDSSPMFSVDCEMCMTTAGKLELTRVCVIDEGSKVSS